MKYRRILEITGSFIVGLFGGKNAGAENISAPHVPLSARDAVEVNIKTVITPKEDIISLLELYEINSRTNHSFRLNQVIDMWQKALIRQGLPEDCSLNSKDVLDLLKLSNEEHSLRSVCAQIPNYEFSAEDLILMKPDEQACKIAEKSKEYCIGTKGSCYHAVKGSIMSAVPFAYLDGKYAYNACQYLSKSPNYVEIPICYANTDKIADGATVVFGKGSTLAGHTYISYKGNERGHYITSGNEEIEYIKSKERSDHDQRANLSGKRKSGQSYGRPYAYFTSGTEIGLSTFFNIAVQYAHERLEIRTLKPCDVLEAIGKLKEESYRELENRAEYAMKEYKSFENAVRNEDGYWIPKKVYIPKRRTAQIYNKRSGNSRI